jgi:hypothetical protein
MSQYKATIIWGRNNQIFFDNQYSRAHKWNLDGNLEIDVSSSPSVVQIFNANQSFKY